jgi:hypothetical protein
MREWPFFGLFRRISGSDLLVLLFVLANCPTWLVAEFDRDYVRAKPIDFSRIVSSR